MFALTDDEEIDILDNEEKLNISESLEIENQDLLISPSEEQLLNENQIKNDLFLNDEIIDDLSPKDFTRKIEIVIDDDLLEEALSCIENSAKTGRIGDGKIFVTNIEQSVRIRTGEKGIDAI